MTSKKKPTSESAITCCLFRTKYLIARIPEPRHDVTMLVEPLVNGGGVKLHVWMCFLQRGDTFRSRYQHQHFNALTTGFFQQVDSRDHGTTGRQHWVNHQRHTLFDIRHQLLEIRHRQQGFFITINADDADTRTWYVFQHAFHHTQTCTQNRHHGNFLALIWSISTGPHQPSIVTFSVSKSAVASYVSRLPTSEASSRKRFVLMSFSRIRPSLCLTSGCFTSTIFIFNSPKVVELQKKIARL